MKLRFIYSEKYRSMSFDKCFCPCNSYLCQHRELIHLFRKCPVLCSSHSPPPHQNNHCSAFYHHFSHSSTSYTYNYPVCTLFSPASLDQHVFEIHPCFPITFCLSHFPQCKNHSFSPVCYKSSSDVIIPGVLCMLSCFSHVQLWDPVDCSPPGSSVYGILQARVLEWVACPPPEQLPHPGIKSTSLMSLALAGEFFTTCATWEAPIIPQ